MLQGEHSAILSTFIKLPFVIKIFVLSIFEWPFYTGFTVFLSQNICCGYSNEHPQLMNKKLITISHIKMLLSWIFETCLHSLKNALAQLRFKPRMYVSRSIIYEKAEF